MDWPSLSVIIPSYNQGPYIERTLLSILRQGYAGPLEVIVSDGGSTDGTVGVLEKYPQVRWWSEKDSGFVEAVTKGLAAATGEVVAIQSSDDYYLPGAFAKAAAALRDDPQLVFVTGNDVFIREDGEPFYPPRKPYVTLMNPGALIGRNMFLYVPQHCTFARRSAVDAVGGLRASVDYCADFDLWYRLLHFGRALMLPDYLAAYQRHPAQRTQNKAELFIRSHKKVVEDAEGDPRYAARFVPTADMKRHIFLQWEVVWNALAGGEEGAKKARALAQKALRHPDDWPDYVQDYVRTYGPSPPSRTKQATHEMLLRIKQNAGLRALFGKRPLAPHELGTGPKEDEPEPVQVTEDVDWWKREDAVPLAALALLMLANALPWFSCG